MKAVMFLHGFSTDARDFAKLIPLLDGIYDTLEFVSYPGHGPNSNIKDFSLEKTFEIMIETYDRLMKNHEEIDVVGFSMGGALATYLQSIRQVSKLVLLAPSNKYMNFAVIPSDIAYLTKLYAKTLRSGLLKKEDEYLFKSELIDYTENFKMAIQFAFNQLLPRYNPKSIRTFMSIIKKCNADLKEITPPTLIIWGHLDQLVPIKAAKYTYSLCSNKNKKLLIFENLSHLMLNSFGVSEVIEEIVGFLKDEKLIKKIFS